MLVMKAMSVSMTMTMVMMMIDDDSDNDDDLDDVDDDSISMQVTLKNKKCSIHQKVHEAAMKTKMKICKRMPCAVQQPPLCDGWVNGSFCNQWKKLQRERSAQLRTATTITSTNGVEPKQNSILEYQSQENCRPDPSREGTSWPFPGRSSPVSFSAWEFPGRLQTSSPR